MDQRWHAQGYPPGKDISLGSYGSYPQSLVALKGVLLFSAADSAKGRELWRSNGTAKGTRRVKDIYAGPTSSQAGQLVTPAERHTSPPRTPLHGDEIWKTKGTRASTQRVTKIGPGSAGAFAHMLTAVGTSLWFSTQTASDDIQVGD